MRKATYIFCLWSWLIVLIPIAALAEEGGEARNELGS
jgi:hypothetical protein